MEKVSAIIITYNRPIEILFRALNSVLNQDYNNIEVIVVNDSPENECLSQEIQDRIRRIGDSRVRYLSYEHNHGSNYARNYGLEHAEGTYIAFLDDDDEWYSDKISRQVRKIEESMNVGLVSCGFDISNGKDIINKKRSYAPKDDSIDYLIMNNYIGGTSFPLLRKSAIDGVGGFDTNMKSCQEYELWIRIREQFEFRTVEDSLGIYYNSNDSTYKNNPGKYYAGDKRIITKHEKMFLQHKNAYNYHLNSMSVHWLRRKRFSWYLEYKLKAISVKPFSWMNLSVVQTLYSRATRIS